MKEKPLRIKVNEYLYVDVIFNNNDVEVVSTNIPEEALSFTRDIDGLYINCCNKEVAVIKIPSKEVVLTNIVLTSTEVKNFSEDVRARGYNTAFRSNRERFEKDRKEGIAYPIELHTHFMEVLSAEEFLDVIAEYIESIPVNSSNKIVDCPIDRDHPNRIDTSKVYKWISIEEAKKDPKILEQLRVPTDRQVEFKLLSEGLANRNSLIDLSGYVLSKDKLDKERDLTKADADNIKSRRKIAVFANMLFKSIEVLKEQGIKYVEFSYSNHNTLKTMISIMQATEIEGITVRFLLSENRSAKAKLYRRNSREVKELLDTYPEVVGFDLMGLEEEIMPIEYSSTGKCKTLYDRLRFTIESLLESSRDKPTLRLHSGEIFYNREGSLNNNPQFILEILKQIEDDLGINLSERLNIRIGHGLHFKQTKEYFDLLKHFNVIVELCASSNFSLGNVMDLSDIPYKIYEENDIPFVIATDGGGFYLTTLKQEAAIAGTFGGDDILKRLSGSPKPFSPTNPSNEEDINIPEDLSIDSIYNKIIEKYKYTDFIKEYNHSNDKMKYIKKYFKNNYTLDIEEEHLFPEGISEEEKLRMEIFRIKSFYHSKAINEMYYTKETENLILEKINIIEDNLKKHKLLDSAVLIFSLEQYLNIRSNIEKIALYMKAYNYNIEDVLGIKINNDIKKIFEDNKSKEKNLDTIIEDLINKKSEIANNFLVLSNEDFLKEYYSKLKLDIPERGYFDLDVSEEEKLFTEIERTKKHIFNKIHKEIFNDKQISILEELIYDIEREAYDNNLLESASYLVSLQTVLGMKVKLESVYFYMKATNKELEDYVDYNVFYNDKGRGKSK